MNSLDGLRVRIDSIDDAIVELLAERFRLTDSVGQYKAAHQLAARDPSREAAQLERITALAEQNGLDPEFARFWLGSVMDRVVQNHERIATESS